jgi:DNA-directed RNA polymerase specialized sigma24 family protein
MGNGLTIKAACQVARVFRDGSLVGMSDRLVLERFVERQDDMAFEAILTRHGPMVRNVCRQILFDPHDVDDAVQAVFLVLVRKARVIRIDESLGPWLYTVARRIAARARAHRRKQWAREPSGLEHAEPTYRTSSESF